MTKGPFPIPLYKVKTSMEAFKGCVPIWEIVTDYCLQHSQLKRLFWQSASSED